jgi:hypothetical protein
MNIASTSYRPTPSLVSARPSEAAEPAGPDMDGDADDVGVKTSAAKAPVASGVGQLLDMVA